MSDTRVYVVNPSIAEWMCNDDSYLSTEPEEFPGYLGLSPEEFATEYPHLIVFEVMLSRKYPDDYCRADIAAYGACILTPNHSGDHKDANGYSFNGTDRKVRS